MKNSIRVSWKPFHLFPFESSYWRQEGGVAAVTALVRLERCPLFAGSYFGWDGEVLVRIEEHFDETKHRKDPNTLLGASCVYVSWVCQREGYVIVPWRVLPGGLALDFRQGLAAFSTRLRAPKLYSTGGFAQAESIRLHRNCHEFWLKYVRNTWGKKTTILSNTFNRMFALIFLRLTATLTSLT